MLKKCNLCARNCGVNRLQGAAGFCHAGIQARIGLASLHHGEEPCLSGNRGSGTVFFSHCNLQCVFCQNHRISQQAYGKEVSSKRLSEIFLEQQSRGAHNLNLVTPTHYVPQIISALKLAKAQGFNLPVLYNTNSYDSVSTIRALAGYIDVYLPDLKYYDAKYASIYSGAPDYFAVATAAIKEMVAQVGEPVFDSDGLMCRGVIIRHLLLPGLLDDSKRIVKYIHTTFGHSVFISLMNQYTPLYAAKEYPEINKPVAGADYSALIDYALELGVENGFIQEGDTASAAYVPNFNGDGV